MARVLRYSTLVASSQPRPPRAVLLGWKLQGMKAVKPPVSSCRLRTTSKWLTRCSMVSPTPNIMVAVVRMPRAWAVRWTSDPILGAALEAGDAMADFVVEDFGAAAGDGVEAGVAEAGDGGAEVELGVLGDGENFGGGEAVQPDVREALLDAGEEVFEPVDLEVGVDAALHEDAGAAHLDGLADLVVDGVEVEDVAFGGELALERPIEGAEGAVLGAEVGVVDVAVDDVADHAFGMKAAADGVGLHADADEVVGGEAIESLLAGNAHRCKFTGFRAKATEGV